MNPYDIANIALTVIFNILQLLIIYETRELTKEHSVRYHGDEENRDA